MESSQRLMSLHDVFGALDVDADELICAVAHAWRLATLNTA